MSGELDDQGFAVVPSLLTEAESTAVAALYESESAFRSRIVMARHGFGSGEYKYFCYPLPAIIASLRGELYGPLAPIANGWHAALNLHPRFPGSHDQYLRRCHAAGQTRPTPLLLRYGAGDYNCLHQDIYGEQVFPLQVAILLSEPDKEFTGGEFILAEQRPRMQSKVTVAPLRRGDGVIFAVNVRPMRGRRGVYRVKLRHGVSVLRSGRRLTAGIIFHDAR